MPLLPSPIPDASSTVRGAVTTGTQTLAGAKTFLENVRIGGAAGAQILGGTNSILTLNNSTGAGLSFLTSAFYMDSVACNMVGGGPDGASAVGNIFDTATAYANASALIASFRTGGVQRFSVGRQGNLVASGGLTVADTITSTVGSGLDAFTTPELRRIRLGAFTEAYLYGWDVADGLLVTGGSLGIGRSLSIRNGLAGSVFSVGTAGTQFFGIDGPTGVVTAAAAINSTVASGSNAIKLLDGARLNFSTADSTAYMYRSAANTITTAGPFNIAGNAIAVDTSGNIIWNGGQQSFNISSGFQATSSSRTFDIHQTQSVKMLFRGKNVGAAVNTVVVGASVVDASIDATCKLFSVQTDTDGTPSDKAWVTKSGTIWSGAATATNFMSALDGARLNFSTADASAYLYRSAANTIRTPGSLTADVAMTTPEVNIGTGCLVERPTYSGSHSIMIRGGAANGGGKSSVWIGATTALAETETLLAIVNGVSSGGTTVFGVRPSGNFEAGAFSSSVASGSDWAAPTVSGARLRIAPSATDSGAYLDYGTTASQTGSRFNSNFGCTGDFGVLSSGGTIFFGVKRSTGANTFYADTAGLVLASVGQNTSTADATVVRTTQISSTAVGNVTTGEDDLMSYTIGASGGRPYGRALRINAWGTTANNANAKSLKLKWGTETLHTIALTVSVAGIWKVEATIIFISDTNQDFFSECREHGVASVMATGTATRDEGGAIILKFTGEATDTNDITQQGLVVEYM